MALSQDKKTVIPGGTKWRPGVVVQGSTVYGPKDGIQIAKMGWNDDHRTFLDQATRFFNLSLRN